LFIKLKFLDFSNEEIDMKKSFVCLLLAVVMIFTSAQGMAFGIANSIPEKDTPVAEIANDDYVPYNYENRNNDEAVIDSLTSEIESVGGYVEKYNSEEEYQRSQKSAASSSVTDYSLTESEIEPVKQTVTVMTTPTGSKEHGNYVESEPVANAIVRLDGVPRYTDRNGQIKATLNREYVELYVEKEGYNPYIEIIEVTGEEKIVSLKKPNDDLEIFSVILSFDNDSQNVMLRPYSVFNEDEDIAYFKVNTNTEVDCIYFLRNGEIVVESRTSEFTFCFLGEDDNAVYTIYYVYNGIDSKIVQLKIKVFSQKEVDMSAFESLGYSANLEPKNENRALMEDGGMFGSFEFDLANLLKLLFPSGKFDFVYDRRENKVQAILGYESTDLLRNKAQWNEGTLKEFDYAFSFFDLNTWKDVNPKLSLKEKKFVTNKLEQFKQIVNDYKRLNLKKKTLSQSFKNQMKPNISINWSVVGAVEGDLTEDRWASKIIGSVDITFEIGGMFLVAGVPLYWEAAIEIEPGFSLNFENMFTDEFKTTFDFIINVIGKVGAGVGFNNLLSAGVYGKLSFENEFEIIPNPHHSYEALTLGVYYKLCLLFLNFEGPIYDYTWTYVDDNAAKVQARTFDITDSLSILSESDDAFIKNIYQQAQPKIILLKNNKKLLVWLTDDSNRSSFNRTNLAYRVQDADGKWSEILYVDDDGTSDFYPQLISCREGVFVVWQNTKSIIVGEVSNLEDISLIEKYGEIKVGKFNQDTNKFDQITSITNNDFMDTYPTFAVKEKEDDPLTIVWQTNSDNNILGTTGQAGLWYSVLKDGEWQAAQNLITEEKAITEYSAGYKDRILQVAVLFDEDRNSSTINDIRLNIYESKSRDVKFNVRGNISSPQYVVVDNELKLFFYYEGKIYKYDLIDNTEQLQGSESIGRYFKLAVYDNELIFTYFDILNGLRQQFISIYDYDTNYWNHRIPITNGQNNVVSCDLIKEGSCITYVSVEEKQSELGCYYDLILDSTKLDLVVEISEATSYKVGDNYKFFVTIKNIGSLTPHLLNFIVDNTIYSFNMLENLYPGEEAVFNFDVSIKSLVSFNNVIIKLFDENDNYLDEYDIILDSIFYYLNIVNCSYGKNNVFELNVNNQGIMDCEYSVIIMNVLTEQIITTINSSQFVDNRFIWESELDFYEDTVISFELITDLPNSIYNELYNTIIEANACYNDNKYYQSLNVAKGIFE